MAHVGFWTQPLPPFLPLKALSLTRVSPAGDNAGLPVDVRLLFPLGQADRQNVAIERETVSLSAPHADQGNVIIIAASPVVPVENYCLHGQLPLKLVLHACVVITHPQQVAPHINTKPAKKETQDLDMPTKRVTVTQVSLALRLNNLLANQLNTDSYRTVRPLYQMW